MTQVVIIGNGIAGITAARHIRKRRDYAITVISSETRHFYSRTALMYVYMGHMKFEDIKPYEDAFWKKNRIDLLFDHADTVDTQARQVHLRSGDAIDFDILIIASGSRSNSLNLRGKHLRGVQSLYGYPDLRTMEEQTRNIRRAVVVGGGLIGVEMAEMLHSRKIDVEFIVREPAIWNSVLPMEEATLITRHIASHGIHLRLNEEPGSVIPDNTGRVRAVVTRSGVEIPCEFVGIAVGVHPNIEWLSNSGIACRRGVLVNRYLETNIPGIYAIGDCVERTYSLEGRKNIEQVWYTGRMMGEVVAQTVCGEKTAYEPGPWFNSAKFFDIEFQAYGDINPTLQDDEEDFYWEHASGMKAIHLVWTRSDRVLRGINAFGIRLRHQRFDYWLRQRCTVDEVVHSLHEANFDSEFSARHEEEIRTAFARYHEQPANSR